MLKNILLGIIITMSTLFFSCTSRKELEAAKHQADMYKIYLIIAVAIAIIGVVVFLIIGNIMGSRARRDAHLTKASSEDQNE